jgi:hypothetical protein
MPTLIDVTAPDGRIAHAFYLRERMEITAFHFTRALAEDVPPLKV